MRRFALLALTLVLTASGAFMLGQGSAAAQPLAIQVVAISPGVYQVSVGFSSDELPVTFTTSAPPSGPTASVSAISLVSCSHPAGSCTASVPDADAGSGYSSGSGLAGFDAGSSAELVTFVVSVTLTCSSEPAGAVIVASQGGLTISAALTCGHYSPYGPLYGPNASAFYGFPYLDPFLYTPIVPGVFPPGANPGYTFNGLVLNGGNPVGGTPLVMDAAYRRFHRPGLGYAVTGGSGTERNLARHALQQVINQLPSYLTAAGVDPSLSAAIIQQVVAYANVYSARPPTAQQITQQVLAYIAAYRAVDPTMSGFRLAPPRTGEAGFADSELYPEFPFMTYYEEASEEALLEVTEEAPLEEAAE
jgi:hypothetical protein